jgi:hypothetical protein
VAVPTPTPVTTPAELTVATDELLVDQVPPEAEETKVVVLSVQIFWFPDRVPATGALLTVTVRVAEEAEQVPAATTE